MAFDGRMSVMSMDRNKKEIETLRLHGKTFKAWCNAYLKKKKLRVAEMETDFCDGLMLISLLELLTGEEPPRKPVYTPKSDFQKIDNCAIAIEFIAKHMRINVNSKDLFDGNQKVLLGLIWRLILHFQVMDKEVHASGGSQPAKARDARKKLLAWCQQKTDGYNGVDIKNFDASWMDGMAFCALVHAYDNTLIDFDNLDPKNVLANVTMAFEIAESKMGVPMLIDPADLAHEDSDYRPDDKVIMTYVSEFPRAFLDKVEHQSHLDDKRRKREEEERLAREREEEERRRLELEAQQRKAAEDERLAAEALAAAAQSDAERLAAEEAARLATEREAALKAQLDAQNAQMQQMQGFYAQNQQGISDEDRLRIQSENDRMLAEIERLRGLALVGVLTVCVQEARGLSKGMTGAGDPYCMLTVERQKEKSKRVKHTTDPKWGAEFKFYVSDPEAVFNIILYNWNRFLSDSYLGKVDVNIPELPNGAQVDRWFPLLPRKPGMKVSGELKLTLLYEADPRKAL
eukprot:TRINITY_DN12710_c0_g1_i1.p2 TRINITY_DN12710_c0_g1~~TRINITY_DN12710_c0_g1_i1.p2  ORF type:complete len:535 (+),score=185.87 TRINITY_DN12710_c0_g1_i1:60-1607(+)